MFEIIDKHFQTMFASLTPSNWLVIIHDYCRAYHVTSVQQQLGPRTTYERMKANEIYIYLCVIRKLGIVIVWERLVKNKSNTIYPLFIVSRSNLESVVFDNDWSSLLTKGSSIWYQSNVFYVWPTWCKLILVHGTLIDILARFN